MASAVERLPEQPAPPATSEKEFPWIAIGWFALLLIVGYLATLQGLVKQWMSDDDMGHGIFVPAVAVYLAWQRREDLSAAMIKPNYIGVVLIIWGTLQLFLGTLGSELFLQRTAFLITLTGVILSVYGTQVLKILAFPLFLMVFMVPIPTIVYNQITFPLQLFASRVAETVLNLIGIPVIREGNVLELASQKLSVVEACSGIRSLLSLTFLSLVYAYFFDSKPWMRWVLLAATIPIAIIANSARVTITGILSEIRPDLAQGFFHSLEGWLIFAVAMVLMIIAHNIINLVYRIVHGKPKSAPVSE